tara:strand:- start:1619 stop:5404 length:3786 start_codon:yes stop_codon:yes gene_type:complete
MITQLPTTNFTENFEPEFKQSIAFSDTVGAMNSIAYQPFIDAYKARKKYGYKVNQDYNAADNIGEEYQPYFNTLIFAQNEQHMADMKSGIDDSIANRRVLANSSAWAVAGAGLFDPINLMPLPFGGAGIGIVKSALRTGAGVGALQAGLEVSKSPYDPVQSMAEGVSNTAMAAASGLLFGGAFSVPLNRRIDAEARHNKAHIEAVERQQNFEDLASLTTEELAAARSNPIRKQFEDDNTDSLKAEATRLRESAVSTQGPMPMGAAEQARLKAVTSELAVRNLDTVGKDPYAIAAGGTGPIYLSTPIRRVLAASVPDSVKERMSRMASDSGLLQNLHVMGKTLGASVYQRMAPLKGEWVKADAKLTELWGLSIGTDIKKRAGMNLTEKTVALESKFGSGQRQTYNDFLVEINRQRIFKEEPKTEVEVAARKVLDDFYDVWGQRLQDTGLIGNKNKIVADIVKVDGRIADLEARLAKIESNPKFKYKKMTVASIRSQMTRATKRKEALQDSLDAIADGDTKVNPANEDFFSPRYFDHATVRARREELEAIISKWYMDNPFIYVRDKSGKVVKQRLDSNKKATDARAKATVDRILNETTEEAEDFFGSGKSMHLKHRGLDIPNKLVWEFMVQNPIDTMKSYVHKTGGRYEFAKMFDGQDFDEMLEDVRLEMMEAGHSQRDINKVVRDFVHMYDRVVTSVMKTDPDRWDNKAAFVMKEAAQLNYLGSAGLSAIPDFGRIIMEHEIGDVLKGLMEILSNERVRLTSEEANFAGEALEMNQGNVHIRMVDDISNNPRATTKYDMMKNAFYIANGLSPITQFAKTLDSIIRGHVIIKDSIAWKNGTISKQNKEYLLRYGISKEMALNIAVAPYQVTEKGFYLPNTKDWENAYAFPDTGEYMPNAKITYGDTGRYRKDGSYVAAAVDYEKKTIKFDVDYIKSTFDEKPWTQPKVEGVKPLAENAFETPQQWANFVMMHEIMHTRFQPEDLKLNLGKGKTYDRNNPKHYAKYENKINDLALKEHNKQPKIEEETLTAFRSALSSGILNTIMMGTPADKPILVDGVAYVPMNVARMFGMKEDARVRGYSRIESGLLGLPFQFYSYALAATNKVAGSFMQGQMKNRWGGLATAMGAGYLSVMIKTPNFAWDNMDMEDRFARAFDQSGVMALYSDLFYTAMSTSLALGGPNISGGMLNPKFPPREGTMGMVDAATGVGGAGVSITTDYAEGVGQFLNGEYGEGAKQIMRSLPFARMWFWKNQMNEATNAISRF